ncbi:hypothetical protein P5E80_15700, partial [Clostridium perfringens]|nr:hypothetical protein [Clostridium perfringens]
TLLPQRLALWRAVGRRRRAALMPQELNALAQDLGALANAGSRLLELERAWMLRLVWAWMWLLGLRPGRLSRVVALWRRQMNRRGQVNRRRQMNRRRWQMRWLAAAAAAYLRGGGARSESQESEGNEQHLHGVDLLCSLE